MFIEDHDYHGMDNTNENVTDNFFASLGFHRNNEFVVNNTTTESPLRFTDVSHGTYENYNLSGIQVNFQMVNGTTTLNIITEYVSSTANLSNASSIDTGLNQPYSTGARIVLAITACVICFVSLVANLLILVTVTLTKRLRTANATFLINLSMGDLLTGAIVLPMVLTGVISNDPSNMFAQVMYEYYWLLKVFANYFHKLKEINKDHDC